MTNSRTTKKALLSSALALLMCVAMLIATTFAWFTDTASTSVNKIQAGKLDVKLYYENPTAVQDADKWKELTDTSDPLGWVQATDANGTTTIISDENQPLWEPGCTFSLPRLKIVNEGNLDFKYKIVISGITGNAELTKAIDWTMELDGNTEVLGTDHNLLAKSEGVAETDNYDIFTISGHMKADAGNEYQGLSIDGIAITVYATQLASEFDSSDNEYDKDALYDLKITESATGNLPVTQEDGQSAIVKAETIISSGSVSVTYPENVKLKSEFQATGDTEKKVSVAQSLTFVENKLSSEAQQRVTLSANQAAASYKLELPVDGNNTVLVPVEINYEKNMTGLEVYHSGTKLGTSEDSDNSGGEYFTYDSEAGTLVLYLKHASSIDVIYDKPGTATVTTAEELEKAFDNESVDTIKLGSDIELKKVLGLAHSVTIDFNGNTIKASGEMIEKYQHVIQVLNTKTSANKLTFMDSSTGEKGSFKSTYGGVKLYSSNAKFELNDIKMECKKGAAIAVADIGCYIVDDDYEDNWAVEDTSIVINSGEIEIAYSASGAIRSGNDNGGKGHIVEINGGKITCGNTWSGIYLSAACTLTINGCTYVKNGSRPFFVCEADGGNAESSVVINNITYTGSDVKIGAGNVTLQDIFKKDSKATGKYVVINGGTFTVDGKTIEYTAPCYPYK